MKTYSLCGSTIWFRKASGPKRYEQINDFERQLLANSTHILKFFLHISKEEQLRRFEQRLDDPAKRWKISEADYTEREYWDEYEKAYEAARPNATLRRRLGS